MVAKVTSIYPDRRETRSEPDHVFNVSVYNEGEHVITQRVRRHNKDEVKTRREEVLEDLVERGFEVVEI